jgi:hypothetical protein
LSLSLSSPLGPRCQGVLVNDGVTATLHASVAGGIASDSWAVIALFSLQLNNVCGYAGGTGDRYHAWPIGIYVP